MLTPDTDWSRGGTRHRRLVARASLCGGWSLAPALVSVALGLLMDHDVHPVRAALMLAGGVTTLVAAVLLLSAAGLRLPASVVVTVACAAIGGLTSSAAPILGAGFATCLTSLHLLGVVSAARVVAERRSYWWPAAATIAATNASFSAA